MNRKAITRLSPGQEEKLAELRRKLHSHAEEAHQERQTMEILKKFLKEETDFIIEEQEGWFSARKKGRTETAVAFRAEMDALPIPEGDAAVSHRCGHDGHMAAVCGVALALKDMVPDRSVVLVFQPAEETGGGGEECARFLARMDIIEEVYACHNRSGYPENSVICRRGLIQPASEGIRITLTGKASHASEPEKGISPAEAVSELALLAASLNRTEPLILCTVVGIRVGTGDFGVSPADGELCVTLRAEREDDMKAAEKAIFARAKTLADAKGLRCVAETADVFPETVNHLACVSRVFCAAEELGLETIQMDMPWRASEDFGHFTKQLPGAMFYVGNGEAYPQLHTDRYEFNDRILGTITEMFLGLI